MTIEAVQLLLRRNLLALVVQRVVQWYDETGDMDVAGAEDAASAEDAADAGGSGTGRNIVVLLHCWVELWVAPKSAVREEEASESLPLEQTEVCLLLPLDHRRFQ